MRITVLLASLLAVLTLQGCATKNYGRLGDVTGFEQGTLTCREIDLEIARTGGFIQQVHTESQFDGRSVLSFLGDFGIGNVMEKNSALKSANDRLVNLQALRSQRCISAQAPGAIPAPGAAAPVGQSVIPASLAPVEEKSGELSQVVEKLARQTSCEPRSTAVLIGKTTGVENYRVDCQDGQQALFKCEQRQCRVLQ
jgi:hypothetical protein